MDMSTNSFVPKVHPLSRGVEPEDPMELVATPAAGDPNDMLECLVQEYALMGWGLEELQNLFDDPAYPVLNELRAYYGYAELERRLLACFPPCGQLQFRENVVEEEPEEREPELIELSVRRLVH
jgi:hypothetical protein